MKNTTLRIDHIKLENYRCFKKLQVDFHPELTVIAARNGYGKTAVLDAVAVALGPYLSVFDHGKGVRFKNTDVRMINVSDTLVVEMEAQYPLTMKARGFAGESCTEWTRELSGAKGRTTQASAKPLTSFGEKLQKEIRLPPNEMGPLPYCH